VFKNLEAIGYLKYLESNPFHNEIGDYGETIKHEMANSFNLGKLLDNVSSTNDKPFQPELQDLVRLHYLCTSRKVVTILEFGCGYSTKIFDHALSYNKSKFEQYVNKNLRKGDPFLCHSLDNKRKWIRRTRKRFKLTNVIFHYSKVRMSTFNDRICTYYDQIPDITPDLIYIDGPSQFGIKGKIRGITTSAIDRLPMAADVLAIEHFLLPGTLIVIDGRTANARFLNENLQRNWRYTYESAYDQSFFELIETPLGFLNDLQLNFAKESQIDFSNEIKS
jgi:hypothetical protein